jgi:xanthine dehydrogenase molybdenum-binding subunit
MHRVGGAPIYHSRDLSRHLTFARAAQRAIELGGKYDGHQLPSNIHAMTRASATALAGRGLTCP